MSINRRETCEKNPKISRAALVLINEALSTFLPGLLLRFIPGLDAPENERLFSDDRHFEVPDDFELTYTEVDIAGIALSRNEENGKDAV